MRARERPATPTAVITVASGTYNANRRIFSLTDSIYSTICKSKVHGKLSAGGGCGIAVTDKILHLDEEDHNHHDNEQANHFEVCF